MLTHNYGWLDGVASNDGFVRQFMAMALGSGYSQVTSEDVIGNSQFEITPAAMPPTRSRPAKYNSLAVASANYPIKEVYVKTLTGRPIVLGGLSESMLVGELKDMIQHEEGIPSDAQSLIFYSHQLDDFKCSALNHPEIQ